MYGCKTVNIKKKREVKVLSLFKKIQNWDMKKSTFPSKKSQNVTGKKMFEKKNL